MSNKETSDKRLSQGLRKHIREEKAHIRAESVWSVSGSEKVKVRACSRIADIDSRLSHDGLNEKSKAELVIERAWIKYALGEITKEERLEEIQQILTSANTETLDYLDEDVLVGGSIEGSKVSRLASIRNKVIDPVTGKLRA